MLTVSPDLIVSGALQFCESDKLALLTVLCQTVHRIQSCMYLTLFSSSQCSTGTFSIFFCRNDISQHRQLFPSFCSLTCATLYIDTDLPPCVLACSPLFMVICDMHFEDNVVLSGTISTAVLISAAVHH